MPSSSFHILWGVRDALGEWSEVQQEHMSLIGLGPLEHSISSVEVVQHTQYSIALVEPEEENYRAGSRGPMTTSHCSTLLPIYSTITWEVLIWAASWDHSRLVNTSF